MLRIYNRVIDTLEELQLHGKTVFRINDASIPVALPATFTIATAYGAIDLSKRVHLLQG